MLEIQKDMPLGVYQFSWISTAQTDYIEYKVTPQIKLNLSV